jgi:hypothetical protein
MKKPNFSVILVVVLLAITLPYIAAALSGGRAWVFAGFLQNPLDGASYLAKMRLGFDGAWRFTLSFSSEPGSGAYLFLYYLLLGHMARWLGLPLILMYHLARLFGAALLLLSIFRFFARIFPTRPDLYRVACWLTAIGSGMGWLIVFAGPPPTDFWVAEAYPFLAMYANPHFPLGLALLLGAFIGLLEKHSWHRDLKLALFGLLLAIILPFAVVLVLLVAGIWMLWTWLETRRLEWQGLFSLGALGGPFLLYQYWAALVDPVLSGWNAQNVTPSPPIWDFLLSFSPAFVLALVGVWALWRRTGEAIPRRLIITWFFLGLLLIYFPFPLQRRFMLGFYIPTAVLAVFGIDFLRLRFPPLARRLAPAVFLLALPTNMLLLMIGMIGAMSQSPLLYLSQDEAQALYWIRDNTPPDALVLSAPEMGGWIPGWTGRRVIYGHPYETIRADQEEEWVLSFYRDTGIVSGERLAVRGVDYVMYGQREQQIGGDLVFDSFPLVYQAGDVSVYSVPGAP